MDTQKLLAIVNDVLKEHVTNSTPTLMSEMRARVAQNTPQGFQLALEEKTKLTTAFNSSRTNDYPPSDARLLVEIGGDGFVGTSASARIDRVFSGNSFELVETLDQYVSDYNTFVSKLTQLKSSLEALGMTAYERENFEIGLTVPTELDDLQVVVSKLNIWDRFLVACSEIAGYEGEDKVTRLARVDNGSFIFFVPKDPSVAQIVDLVLAHAAALYLGIKKIQKARLEVENLEIDQQVKKKTLANLKQAEVKKREEYVEKVTTEVFDEVYKGQDDRKEELRGQFGTFFKLILKFVQQGVEPEVAPPSKADESTTEEEMAEVVAHAKDLKKLYSEPLEQRLLAFNAKVTDEEMQDLENNPSDESKPEPKKPKSKPDTEK